MPGAPIAAKYESDNGQIYAITVGSTTIDATINPSATGTINGEGNAHASTGHRRSYGIWARYVSYKYTATLPGGYKSGTLLRLPILTKTAYNTFKKNTDYTFNGSTIQIKGKQPEKER